MEVVDWISRKAGRLADNFNKHNFYVAVNTERPDSSTMISLTPYTSREQQALVPCTFKWTRVKNGITSDVDEFRGNTFMCEPSDVGAVISAQVTTQSTDQQYAGTAMLKFGPVTMDVLLKQAVQLAVSTGQGKFYVDVCQGESTRQCLLNISDDFIKINHCNSSLTHRFIYNLVQPQINSHGKQPQVVSFSFPPKYEPETLAFLAELFGQAANRDNTKGDVRLAMKFLNRKQKDEFLFVMKGFNAKKQLKNSLVVSKIEKLQVDSNNLGYLTQLESLKSDLHRLHALNKRAHEQKKIYYDQSCKLEQEIQDIISSYTKLIEGKFKTRQEFEESFIDFENKKDNAIAHKYQKIEEENQRLKDYIREQMDGQGQPVVAISPPPNNPFTRKKQPFQEIAQQQPFQNILHNLSGEEEGEEGKTSVRAKLLERQLSESQQRVRQLQGELERQNRSGLDMNDLSRDSRHNMSALEISTGKVVEEKVTLERKYAVLKEDYRKLKRILKEKQASSRPQSQPPGASKPNNDLLNYLKDDSLLLRDQTAQHPTEESSQQVQQLKQALIRSEGQAQEWRQKAEELVTQLQLEKQAHSATRMRLERRVADLLEEVGMSRRREDVLNRSQHLSMQMDEYNNQQHDMLKDQNSFLLNQNERLTKMCEKYKGEYKRLKNQSKGSPSP